VGRVTAVVCAAFDPATDEAVLDVRSQVRRLGVALPDQPPHRPHVSLAAATVDRAELDGVLDVAATVASRHEAVPVRLGTVGRFGRAGALWLGPDPSPELAALQADVYRSLLSAGYASAFGERSDPDQWVGHCSLAVRVEKPLLRSVQSELAAAYEPIHATIDSLVTILVGGRGDVARAPLAAA
jgi:2'-5' RNA ligase